MRVILRGISLCGKTDINLILPSKVTGILRERGWVNILVSL